MYYCVLGCFEQNGVHIKQYLDIKKNGYTVILIKKIAIYLIFNLLIIRIKVRKIERLKKLRKNNEKNLRKCRKSIYKTKKIW